MGIDAEMFIKRKGPKPSDEQLKTWSWDLCAAIGAQFFYFRKENGQAALELTGKYLQKYYPEIVLGKIHTQDGPDINAADDEWFIEVNLVTRYYGVGYERGNWQVIVNVARWLELNIGGEVWYGGDTSGVCAELFDEAARQKLVEHALGPRGKDYYFHFNKNETFRTPPPCNLCVKDRRMIRYDWGDNYIAVSCRGCGKDVCSHDGGETWEKAKPL